MSNIASYSTFNTNKNHFQDYFPILRFLNILAVFQSAEPIFSLCWKVLSVLWCFFSCDFLRFQGSRPWEIAIWILDIVYSSSNKKAFILSLKLKQILFPDSALLRAIYSLLSHRDGINARLYSAGSPMCSLYRLCFLQFSYVDSLLLKTTLLYPDWYS